MKVSELHALLRLAGLRTDQLENDPTLRFEREVALKLGYYVDWDSMVKH